jgi:hypothetical protein
MLGNQILLEIIIGKVETDGFVNHPYPHPPCLRKQGRETPGRFGIQFGNGLDKRLKLCYCIE